MVMEMSRDNWEMVDWVEHCERIETELEELQIEKGQMADELIYLETTLATRDAELEEFKENYDRLERASKILIDLGASSNDRAEMYKEMLMGAHGITEEQIEEVLKSKMHNAFLEAHGEERVVCPLLEEHPPESTGLCGLCLGHGEISTRTFEEWKRTTSGG